MSTLILFSKNYTEKSLCIDHISIMQAIILRFWLKSTTVYAPRAASQNWSHFWTGSNTIGKPLGKNRCNTRLIQSICTITLSTTSVSMEIMSLKNGYRAKNDQVLPISTKKNPHPPPLHPPPRPPTPSISQSNLYTKYCNSIKDCGPS